MQIWQIFTRTQRGQSALEGPGQPQHANMPPPPFAPPPFAPSAPSGCPSCARTPDLSCGHHAASANATHCVCAASSLVGPPKLVAVKRQREFGMRSWGCVAKAHLRYAACQGPYSPAHRTADRSHATARRLECLRGPPTQTRFVRPESETRDSPGRLSSRVARVGDSRSRPP